MVNPLLGDTVNLKYNFNSFLETDSSAGVLFLVSCCSYGCCGEDVDVEWGSALVSREGLGSLLCWAPHRIGVSTVHFQTCWEVLVPLLCITDNVLFLIYYSAWVPWKCADSCTLGPRLCTTALPHSSARAAGPVPTWAVARNK